MPKLGTKHALLEYFWLQVLKNYCHIWNQHPQICQTAKFQEKTKMPKFVTKNALFRYFGARILTNYCYIWNQHSRICRTAKFKEKQKCLILGPKMSYLGIFRLEFENNIVIFEIATLEFV